MSIKKILSQNLSVKINLKKIFKALPKFVRDPHFAYTPLVTKGEIWENLQIQGKSASGFRDRKMKNDRFSFRNFLPADPSLWGILQGCLNPFSLFSLLSFCS